MSFTHFWHCLHLSGRKSLFISLCLLAGLNVTAQNDRMNNPEHDEKPYYFGITLGFNSAQYRLNQSKFFTEYDTVKNIKPIWGQGFQLGIMGNLKLSNFVDVRAIPSFMIREKALDFTLYNDSVKKNYFESVLFSLPIEFKFKSDRQNNFRFYVCAGGKFDYDFNSNARSRRLDDVIKVKPVDYGYNVGLGFEFYYPNFIFSPEIKVSNGMGNSIIRDVGDPTNKAIDRISTRMIIISFHIEG